MNKLIFSILIILSTVSWSQKKAILTGEIQNPKSEWVYLRSWDKSDNKWTAVILDSCKLKKGNFELAIDLDSLTNLDFYDNNETAQIYIKPGEHLHLKLNTQYFDETLHFTGDGAERNNLMAMITLMNESIYNKRSLLLDEFKLDPSMDTIPFFKKLHQVDSSFTVFLDFEIKENQEMEIFIQQTRNNILFYSDSFKNNGRKALKFEKMKKEETGKPFTDAIGMDLEGNEVNISHFYGKLTVLDFWATWCGPCRAEFPGLHELEKKYEGRVTFLGIASFCKKEDWQKMATEEGFEHSIFIEKEKMDVLTKKYAINTIPRYMILDESGNIINLDAVRPSLGLGDVLDKLLNK